MKFNINNCNLNTGPLKSGYIHNECPSKAFEYCTKAVWLWLICVQFLSSNSKTGKLHRIFEWQTRQPCLKFRSWLRTEYSGDMNTGLVWYLNGQKSPLIRWSVIQMVIWIPYYFSSLFKLWISGQLVHYFLAW